MSETASGQTPTPATEFRSPEQEQAEKGRRIAPVHEIPLEEVNPLNANLFSQNRWEEYFERLRKEDPVHFNEIESAGRYWSVTKYDDIKAVNADWKTFSSAHGITLGFRVGAEVPRAHAFRGQSSVHLPGSAAARRSSARPCNPSVAPRNLVKLEPLIRERTCRCSTPYPKARRSTGSTPYRSS